MNSSTDMGSLCIAAEADGNIPLHVAAQHGALAAFDFLRERCGIEARTIPHEYTCLHLAAAYGHENIVDRILGLPGSRTLFDSVCKSKGTALHYAAASLHANCITALLKIGLDPNQKTGDGQTALQLALANHSGADEADLIAALRALLADERTNPNVEDGEGRHPLALAEGNRALLRELLKHPRVDLRRPVRKEGGSGIFLAAREGVWGAVLQYIDEHGLPAGMETDGERNTFFHHLTARNAPKGLFFERISEISESQLNACNNKGQTPFHRALIAKNWPLADRLFETGKLNLHQSGDGINRELWVALQARAPETLLKKLVASLVSRLAETDSDGWTLLHHVAATNYARLVETLSQVTDLGELWQIPDRQGRRPIDLGGKSVASIAPKGMEPAKWPGPIGWDKDVGWKAVAKTKTRKFIKRIELDGVDAETWELSRGTLAF